MNNKGNKKMDITDIACPTKYLPVDRFVILFNQQGEYKYVLQSNVEEKLQQGYLTQEQFLAKYNKENGSK
jgi:hypothetical protein